MDPQGACNDTYSASLVITSAMSHNHSHNGCHDESHDHDHNHDIPEAQGHRDNLYSRIDRQNVVALNAEAPGKGPEVIKPWDERLDEQNVRIRTYTL